MAVPSFPEGSLLRLSVLFEIAATEVAADPTAVTLQIGTPAGVNTTYTYGVGSTIVKDGTGTYHADIVADQDGDWRYYWRGTGAVVAGRHGIYTVTASGF